MARLVVLIAIIEEVAPDFLREFNIAYTGIGKINATIKTFEVISKYNPDCIINIGTAGVVNPNLVNKVSVVKEVIERDALCEPLSPRGVFPFDEKNSIFRSSVSKGVKLATGDSFVSGSDPWLLNNQVDLVDMEYFAIAKTASKFGIATYSLKYGSDLTNSNAATDWTNSLLNSSKLLSDALNSFVEEVVK